MAVGELFTRLNAFENTVFQHVPAEIIQIIASYLPLSAAASFSLSCLAVRNIVGTQYVTRIGRCVRQYQKIQYKDHDFSPEFWKIKKESGEFLILLGRDLPEQQVACILCLKFHTIKYPATVTNRKFRAKRQKYKPPCFLYDRVIQLACYLKQEFSKPLFQKILAWSQDITDHNQLVSLALPGCGYMLCNRKSYQHEEAAVMRIVMPLFKLKLVDGSLFIRRRLTVPVFPKPLQRKQYSKQRKNRLRICDHLLLVWEALPNGHVVIKVDLETGTEFHSEWKTVCIEGVPEHESSPFAQCPACLTTYKIDFQSYEKQGTLVFCTAWTELGRGPSSACWKSLRMLHAIPAPPLVQQTRQEASAFQFAEEHVPGAGLSGQSIKNLFRAAQNGSLIRRIGWIVQDLF